MWKERHPTIQPTPAGSHDKQPGDYWWLEVMICMVMVGLKILRLYGFRSFSNKWLHRAKSAQSTGAGVKLISHMQYELLYISSVCVCVCVGWGALMYELFLSLQILPWPECDCRTDVCITLCIHLFVLSTQFVFVCAWAKFQIMTWEIFSLAQIKMSKPPDKASYCIQASKQWNTTLLSRAKCQPKT